MIENAILHKKTPTISHFLGLVLLNAGIDGPPVFLAHGLGSSPMEFSELVKHLRTSRAIYGFRAKGSDGLVHPLTRIEEMAQFNIDVMRVVQPHGPYTLIGYSLGGLVVLEMAHRLSAVGEKVASLVMIDSYPRTKSLVLWKRIHLLVGQMRYRGSDAMQSLKRRGVRAPLDRVRKRARFSDFLAWTRYRPAFYGGEMKFVRAAESHYPDPTTIWPRLAAEFEVEILPGDHHSVISIYSENLASALNRHLNRSPHIDE